VQYGIYPLSDVLELTGTLEKDSGVPDILARFLNSGIDSFECARSPHHTDFIRNKARNNEASGASRTYLLVNFDLLDELANTDTPAACDPAEYIVGYFAIGLTSLDLSDEGFSNKQRKRLRGGAYTKDGVLGCYVIGEICRSSRYTSEHVAGIAMLEDCIQAIRQAHSIAGGRCVIVESRKSVYESMYSKLGFDEMPIRGGQTDDGEEMLVSILGLNSK
jgi:hypothetical protein